MAAVVAYVLAIVADVFVGDRLINVRVVNDGSIDIGDGCVIAEVVACPNAGDEPGAVVAEPVVDAPIKADARTPITRFQA